MPPHILLIDDDALYCRVISGSLRRAGYAASTVGTAEDGLACLHTLTPDLILLDLGLPDRDGLEVLRVLRHQCNLPVIVVTGRSRELDEIVSLELGADDYITKPVSDDILIAHMKAVLRRVHGPTEHHPPLVVGDMRFDLDEHRVQVKGHPVELSPKEYQLLLNLAHQAGHVLSVNELLTAVWGADWIGEAQTVYVHIRWLRQKLENDPAHPRRLVTMKGMGYKLNPIIA